MSEVRWAGVATGLFLAGLVAQIGGAPAWSYWSLYLGCYLAGGWEPTKAGLKALRDKTIDVDLLMVVAAVGAAAIGQVFDGALLIVIFATSGALEAVATRRTEDSVRSLLSLTPETASRLTVDGAEEVIDSAALDVGDVLVIKPGERIGGDGVVIDGVSDVDQSSVTGESLPVDKLPGDPVFAGTANGTGTLRVRMTTAAADTVLARTVAMVAEASASRARMQLFIEKVEQRYSVVMVIATVALFVIPMTFGADLESALLRAMTFMIVASPCALVLSTMPPLLSVIANAGRHGVLVKSAVVLEKISATTIVAFDKTGTLTEGTPVVTDCRATRGSGVTDAHLLSLAAAVESASQHPLGRAVVDAARDARLPVRDAQEFSSTPGLGVRAAVDGAVVDLRSPARTSNRDGDVRGLVDELESAGKTVVVVRRDGEALGVLAFTDRLRPGAREMVEAVTALTGRSPVLLTGDNSRAAARVAAEVGIVDVRAELLPHDKVSAVESVEADGEKVMVVGDGVNDAPAMARATVGVAMGGVGSDLALDTADVIVTRDDLSTLPALLALARRARRVVVANLAIAGTVIVGLVTWDLVGHLPLPLGVAGHEGSTILVGLNGLRLLRDAAWKPTVSPVATVQPRAIPTSDFIPSRAR